MRLVPQVGDDAITAAARLVEIGGFQGDALALRCHVEADGVTHPPAAVVPKVVGGLAARNPEGESPDGGWRDAGRRRIL